ncbi:hypothetical protein [Colwellia sp. BRX10-4]|jgi:hypothetical protein|uniref:hypothetical protein n=1 Tax=Colwellia sp. BRX10-4 TaxID=2759843 RepID=UPI0015F4E690|nr:hypothetical protein [Colwellia sp. BRX10-4]MBA6399881.1 hypothetical protein [Colwellia sp. BRX10-4]
MHVRVTDVSFTIDQPWIFKFRDSAEKEYLAFDTEFYTCHGLKCPINRMHLDQLDVGMASKIKFVVISGENVVTSIN